MVTETLSCKCCNLQHAQINRWLTIINWRKERVRELHPWKTDGRSILTQIAFALNQRENSLKIKLRARWRMLDNNKQKVASWINSLTSHTEGQIVVTVIWPFSYHYRAKYTVLINCTQWYSITGNYSISRIISCVISQFRSLFWCKQHLEIIFTLKTFTVSLESMIYFSILIW